MIFFFLRIFPQTQFRWACHAMIAYTSLGSLLVFFMLMFQCMPINYNWDGWRGDFGPHQCLDITELTVAASSLSISQDFLLLVLPMPLLYNLNISLRNKIGVIMMFSLGVFILLTSCIRLQYILQFRRTLNPTWDYTDVMIWSAVEISVSVLVPCLPAVRIWLNKRFPNFLGTTNRDQSRLQGSYGLADPSSRATSKHQTSGSRGSKFRPKSGLGIRSSLDDTGSDVELGYKLHGGAMGVLTEIGASPIRPTLHERAGSCDTGIYVLTTTTVEGSLHRADSEDTSGFNGKSVEG
jgi:hypothetical protein